MQSIREIFKINTVRELNVCSRSVRTRDNTKTEPLVAKLEQNILSSDVVRLNSIWHMLSLASTIG